MNDSMWGRAVKWLSKKTKKHDRFSIPICLNYKGETSFSTTIGVIGSFIIGAVIFIYTIILLIQLANKDNSVINSSIKTNEIVFNSKSYNFIDYNIVFGLYEVNGLESILLDPSYNIKLRFNNYNWLTYNFKSFTLDALSASVLLLREREQQEKSGLNRIKK